MAVSSGFTGAIDRRRLDIIVSRVSRFWPLAKGVLNPDSKAVVVVSRFEDLPAPVVAYAKSVGYDNGNPKDRVPAVTHNGRIYMVHENISSEIEAEEALFHEHIHRVLRSQPKDAFVESMNNLYTKLGGGKGILGLAKNLSIDFKPYRAQASTLLYRARVCLYMEEFLAHAEGARAYHNVPEQAKHHIQTFWGEFRHYLRGHGFMHMAEKIGVKLNDFTQSDLAYLLKGVREGTPYGIPVRKTESAVSLEKEDVFGDDSRRPAMMH